MGKMMRDTVIGLILLIMVLCVSTYLVLWARHLINKIGKRGADTARKIKKEING